jgi:hypothetical protein
MLKITARQIVAGIGTGLLAGLLAVAFESEFQGRICEYNQATKHEDCPTYSLFPFLFIQVCKTLNDYGVAITGIATVFLTFITWRLVIVARDQSKTTRAQLRAYVFGNGGSISLIDPPEGDMQLHVCCRFKNSGQTPAHKARIWTRFEIFDVNAPVFSQSIGLGNFVIGPGANYESTLGRAISYAELADIRDERKAIFIWGEIKYVDAFGEDRYFRFYDRNGPVIPGKGWAIANSDKPYEAN